MKPAVQTASATSSKVVEPTYLNASPSIKTIESLLPPENSRERETEVSHVMLHFMSNGAVKPNDLRTI